jgi:transposase
MEVIEAVKNVHASVNTKQHCIYMYFFLGISKTKLATLFNKAESTIGEWIKRYEDGEGLGRKKRDILYVRYGTEKREWLVKLYEKRPILYLDEAKYLFDIHFNSNISKSSISVILSEAKLTWKVLESRAIQINQRDVLRFAKELLSLPWILQNLVFLDEVSFDNRTMIRKKGYARKGERLIFRGEFNRKPRVSLLSFVGVNGLLETYHTEGTFNRTKFMECCRDFALSSGKVKQYPGNCSVWILDGAKIHCDANAIYYLRSLGNIPIFLPAYCPFFNPIELVFGMVKRKMDRRYDRSSKIDLVVAIAGVMNTFVNHSFDPIFRKCGYSSTGFNAGVAFQVKLSELGYE